MSDAGSGEQSDLEQLRARLKALSSVNRLRLISELKDPKTVDEIRLTPADRTQGSNPDRQLTRQGVRHHLSQLEDLDLIRSSPADDADGRDRLEYVANEPAVFGVLEELRELVAPGSEASLDPFQTYSAADEPDEEWTPGPKLVLLRGAQEDRVFSLTEIEPDPDPARGWVLGRSPEAQISLQYDPYLSAQNTEVVRDGDQFLVVDLRTSRNGTIVNDERLAPGREAPLEHGDVIRIGCSALLFREK